MTADPRATAASSLEPFNESAAVKSLAKDAAVLSKELAELTKLKPGSPDTIEKLDRIIAALPDGGRLTTALNELRERGRALVREGRAARIEAFRRFEVDWVQGRRASGVIRETGTSRWRTGVLEVEVDRERSRAQAFYNNEPITAFIGVSQPKDLDALVEKAEATLARTALEPDDMEAICLAAYEGLRRRRDGVARVPILEFYREFRIEHARRELQQKPDRKLSLPDFPRWAFAYNLDRYRHALAGKPSGKRLYFETGSAADTQRGLAMVLNGLDPSQEYRSYCYVSLSEG